MPSNSIRRTATWVIWLMFLSSLFMMNYTNHRPTAFHLMFITGGAWFLYAAFLGRAAMAHRAQLRIDFLEHENKKLQDRWDAAAKTLNETSQIMQGMVRQHRRDLNAKDSKLSEATWEMRAASGQITRLKRLNRKRRGLHKTHKEPT